MKEKNRKYLKNAIRELPDLSPDHSLWKNISKEIRMNHFEMNRDILNRSIRSLPVFKPEENAWNSIKENIKPYKTIVRSGSWKFYVAGIATSMLILISVIYYNSEKKESDLNIGYETFPSEINETLFTNKGNTEIEKYIIATCSQLPEKCNSQEYSDYQNELTELKQELQKMKKNIEEYNQDIEYVKHYIRIEKQIDDLNKNFMDFLMI